MAAAGVAGAWGAAVAAASASAGAAAAGVALLPALLTDGARGAELPAMGLGVAPREGVADPAGFFTRLFTVPGWPTAAGWDEDAAAAEPPSAAVAARGFVVRGLVLAGRVCGAAGGGMHPGKSMRALSGFMPVNRATLTLP